jgi:hypothetical protein
MFCPFRNTPSDLRRESGKASVQIVVAILEHADALLDLNEMPASTEHQRRSKPRRRLISN